MLIYCKFPHSVTNKLLSYLILSPATLSLCVLCVCCSGKRGGWFRESLQEHMTRPPAAASVSDTLCSQTLLGHHSQINCGMWETIQPRGAARPNSDSFPMILWQYLLNAAISSNNNVTIKFHLVPLVYVRKGVVQTSYRLFMFGRKTSSAFKDNLECPRVPWRPHTVAWRGRTLWRSAEAPAVYCSFLTRTERIQLPPPHGSQSVQRERDGRDSWLYQAGAMAYAYLFKYIIIGDTGRLKRAPATLAASILLAASS